jgi:S1-C subfamily serine protease
MSPLPRSLRWIALALAFALIMGNACAQEIPDRKITGEEIRRALIWTGHFSVMTRDEPEAAFRNAFHSWQKSRHYAETKELPEDQVPELLSEGDRVHDSVGWAKLEDKSIGLSLGVPTRLVKFIGARNDNGGLRYDFEGAVTYTLGVRYGDLNCANLDTQLAWFLRRVRPTFKAKYADGYAMGSETNYIRAVCRTTGVVIAGIDIPKGEADKYGMLISAMAESLVLTRHFNPTAPARARLDAPAPSPGDLITASTRPASADKNPASVDDSGKTDALKREGRDGHDLSVEEVFAKVSPAVYVVRAGERLGSAVAISEHELLTNCHVVKDQPHVTLSRDKIKRAADIASRNEKADRCVLKTTDKLESWVGIRPYDGIKVGERALTVGTPQGLELTVADGIVSSKRTHEQRRLIQTSAPISQGSSGGGLFDAQGNLLGITTFQMRVGQNLNFAIAAEDYAR